MGNTVLLCNVEQICTHMHVSDKLIHMRLNATNHVFPKITHPLEIEHC